MRGREIMENLSLSPGIRNPYGYRTDSLEDLSSRERPFGFIDSSNKGITLVTAFFDIGRADYKLGARSNDEYFLFFDFWARIRNNLIIYCAPTDVHRIWEIRAKYHRERNTYIIPVVDIYDIEPEIYQKMKIVENSTAFKEFRYVYDAVSNHADYDYLMLLKYWFLRDTARNYSEMESTLAWLDFGYNHGGDHYTDPKDFDFQWSYNFDNKINMFCLSSPDQMAAIDSLQFQKDCFIGHTVVSPRSLADKLWKYVKEAMNALLSLDCIDDDQQLLLMVYKMHKDDCTIRICNWFEDMEICSSQRFSVTLPPHAAVSKSIERKSIHFLERCNKRIRYYYP